IRRPQVLLLGEHPTADPRQVVHRPRRAERYDEVDAGQLGELDRDVRPTESIFRHHQHVLDREAGILERRRKQPCAGPMVVRDDECSAHGLTIRTPARARWTVANVAAARTSRIAAVTRPAPLTVSATSAVPSAVP